MDKNTEKKLNAAKIQLILRCPFFGSILCRRPPVITKRIGTAAVNNAGKLFINPDFVAKLTVDQIIFLLAHETMHITLLHALRKEGRDHKLWNIACDSVINTYLTEHRIGTFIPGGVGNEGFVHGENAETIYAALCAKQDRNKGNGREKHEGDGEGEPGEGNSDDEGKSDSHIGGDLNAGELDEKLTDAEKRMIESDIRTEVAQAKTVAKLSGGVDRALDELTDGVLKVETPWEQALEQYLTSRGRQEQSWKRPNRRYAQYAYLPSQQPVPSIGTIVLGIDTSGSVDDEELAQFFREINRIMELCTPERVVVMYCADYVNLTEEFGPDDYPIKPSKSFRSGGTDMREIFRTISDRGINADAAVIFTDGYTPYPVEKQMTCPAVWAVTTGTSMKGCPGKIIRFKKGAR